MSGRRGPRPLPPPISFGDEPLDAAVVLHELRGDTALCLWKTVRSVALWAAVPPERRAEAFAQGAREARLRDLAGLELPPEVARAMEAAAEVLAGPAPPEEVAAACRTVSDWADQQACLGTALEFMQAAALADPAAAGHAHATARLARRRGEYARAESWYRQAAWAARQSRDRVSLARTFLGLGITYMLRGNFPGARKTLVRGIRVARRHGLREEAAMLYHELAVLAIRTARSVEVARYARASFEAYGPGHPRLSSLAHDVAVFWMNRGYFEAALAVFRAEPAMAGASDRLATAACLARCAAAVGERALYAASWEEASRLVRSPEAAEAAATALVDMARGAVWAGDWERAAQTAQRAYALARERGEAEQLLEAESVLEVARSRHALEAATDRRRPPRQVERLAEELVAGMAGAASG